MKTYIDIDNSTISLNGTSIPKSITNADYNKFLDEQQKGLAVLIPYTPPAPTWDGIRNQRDLLLKESDWSDLPNTPLSNKQDWINYRQALRDVPQAYPSPSEVIWPQKP